MRQIPVAQVATETWMVKNADQRSVVKSSLHGEKRPVTKIATRVRKGAPGAGQFIGSTNYRGTVNNNITI